MLRYEHLEETWEYNKVIYLLYYNIGDNMYCPRCKSRLYPIDKKYIDKYSVCSNCITYEKKESIKWKQKQKK